MLEMLPILAPIVVTDAMNPVLAATVIFALATPRPYRTGLWVLSGWFTVYFLAGLGLTIGLGLTMRALSDPQTIGIAIQIPIALALIWFAYKTAREKESSRAPRQIPQPMSSTHTMGGMASFNLGAAINLVGLPFALPYFAAINQILKANLTHTETTAVLALYNLLYVLPFATLGLLRLIYRDGAAALFERIHVGIETISAVIMPILLFLIGAVLTLDAVLYFATGNPLINVAPPMP